MGSFSSEMMAPLHSHNERQVPNGLDLLDSRGVSMPDCRQPTILPQAVSTEGVFGCLAGKRYKTSSETEDDNVSRISDLSLSPTLDHHASIQYNSVDVYSQQHPTRYRHRSQSSAAIDGLSPSPDRKYLFVNRTVKDGRLISRGVQASGSWKTKDRRKTAAREEERKVTKAAAEVVSSLKDLLKRRLGQGISLSDLLEEPDR